MTDITAITSNASLSPYRLIIYHCTAIPDVLRFRGREALSEPFRWDVEFTCGQHIAATDVLMKFASLKMRSGKVAHGVITGFKWLSTTFDQSHYRVFLESRLALLSRTRRCRVFQNLSVPELAEQLLREHGHQGADFDFQLTRAYPTRELFTQWREDDLQFLRRILAEAGIWFRSEMNAKTEQEILIFADSQLGYHSGVTLPYRQPSGLHDDAQESVWGVRSWHNVVTGQVTGRDYNYRQASEPADAKVAVRHSTVTTGEHYRYAPPFLNAGDDVEPDSETGAFYARIHHERELNKSAHLHLFSNASHLSPGTLLEAQGEIISALKEGVVITLTTFRASRDSRLFVSVRGLPYSEQFCFRPAEIPRPVISGTLPARVESRHEQDIYPWLDEQGRYRVKLNMDREDSESGYSYLWVRQAKPYAGSRYGWHTPLMQGTEVAIAFDGGDPDRPYIAHAFHDSEHPEIVSRDNSSQNILRTPAGNELRMEDRRGEEHIAASTGYGATQLNQGHITDAQEKMRGIGFELRTDEYGVIRVAKGLFISADGQAKAKGEVLDMATALKEIDLALKQMEQLKLAAEQAAALEADIDSQRRMFSERLKPLNKVIHFSAPEGMAFTSGEHLQLAATENVALNAGGELSLGAMGNINLMAGEQIGLFAQSARLSVIAGQGPVIVQAQNAGMQLTSGKKLTISAAEDILIAGKKRVVLAGGGSYLKLEAGRIEYGTGQQYLRKVERTFNAPAQRMPVEMPVMPLADRFASQNRELNPVMRLGDAPGVNGQPQAQRRWQIVAAASVMEAISTDDVLISGESGTSGLLLSSQQQERLTGLAQQYSDPLWLVIGQRAHRLRFNVIPAAASDAVKDACALDTLGYHQAYNSVTGSMPPGDALLQCVRSEQNAGGALLLPLTEGQPDAG